MLLVAMAFLVGISGNAAKAASFVDVSDSNFKVVGSAEELEEFFESENYCMSFEGLAKSEKKECFYELTVTEPGWVVSAAYVGEMKWGYDEFDAYLFTSFMMTKSIDRGDKTENITAELYDYIEYSRFYVNAGTYYFKACFTADGTYEGYDSERNCTAYLAFLPSSVMCKVDSIEYNDDFTEATVNFKTVAGRYNRILWASKKNESKEAMKNTDDVYFNASSNYWDGRYYNPASEANHGLDYNEEVGKTILSEGWTITENGDYSLYYVSREAEYSAYPVVVNFTIDKLGSKAKDVEPKSVKLNKTTASLKVGGNITLKATLKPKNVTLKSLKWTSSNAKVAAVDKNGKVTAKKKGTCVITVTTENGKKAKCKVTVK